jgi:hypothetical protein
MKQSIVWLASYPKSGNTWVRLFVANYIVNRPDPLPINQIHKFGIGDSIAAMYSKVAGRTIGVNDVALSLQLRDRVLAGVVANNADINLVKTHNRRTVAHGVQMIPEKFTRSAIYVMRNPLDMVLSYARHYGIENAEATGLICHTDNANAPTDRTVAEFLGSWSDHVESWTGKSAIFTSTGVGVRIAHLLVGSTRYFTAKQNVCRVKSSFDRSATIFYTRY